MGHTRTVVDKNDLRRQLTLDLTEHGASESRKQNPKRFALVSVNQEDVVVCRRVARHWLVSFVLFYPLISKYHV